MLLGLAGAVATYKRPSILRAFLIWDFILSLVVYSLANERFSWLVMHPLLPLTLLAGFGVQVIWEARHGWGGKLGLALVAARRAARGLRLVPRERAERRRPARVPRHDAVLRCGHRRPRRGVRGQGARRPRGPRPLRRRRQRGGRDVPLGVVLPPPRRDVSRPHAGGAALRGRRGDRHPGRPRPRRRRARGLRGARVPVPRLVGARLRRDVARRPGGTGSRSASRGTRRAACPSGSTCARAPSSARSPTRSVSPLSKTRSPSRSHFATPASPWSVRSSGPTTT